MRPISEIIVHCTATRPAWREGQHTATKVREVRRWHTQERGWSDIGYHYLIDRDGTVAEGRPIERTGAHVKGRNTGSIGVALFGGHGGAQNDRFEDNFTPEQEAALRQLLTDLSERFPAINKISGHNEYANKACPCFDVRAWLKGGPVAAPQTHNPTPRPARPTGGLMAFLRALWAALTQRRDQ